MVKRQTSSSAGNVTADTIKRYIKESQGNPNEEFQLHKLIKSE
jgi:putative transposase